MNKISLIAAMIVIGFGAVATATAPVLAAGVGSCQSEKIRNADGVFVDKVQIFANSIKMTLRQQGYNVSSVEPWGGCVRAFITTPDGGTKFQYFDPDTLQPLN